MGKKNTVTKEQVDELIRSSKIEAITFFGKTTVTACQLPNGFVIVEASSCVDPANYDGELGLKICKERIENRIWELEGYKLQASLHGEAE